MPSIAWNSRRLSFVLVLISAGFSLALCYLAHTSELLKLQTGHSRARHAVSRDKEVLKVHEQGAGRQTSQPFGDPKDIENQHGTTYNSTWHFVSAEHARVHTLSEKQCEIAFPNFGYEIDRAASFWEERGGITEGHVDISWQKSAGMVRLMIYDQQLFVIEKKWAVPNYDIVRALSLLHSINRAILTSPEPIPDVEFSITLGDWPDDPANEHPAWVLSRSARDTAKWVMPDFGYWSWPLDVIGEYTEIRRQIAKSEPTWEDKKSQAVWRGATVTNPLRDALVRASKGKSWSDIKAVSWKNGSPTIDDDSAPPLSIPQHCDYKFVVHTEGHSYSGRTKYLLNCHSVSIVHAQEWIEPHSHLYRSSGPDQNIVAVKRSFSNLDSVMSRLLRDDETAKRVAQNSVDTFRDRYLTPAAQTCYWRRMIRTWRRVSTFEPVLYDQKIATEGARGVTFESFVADLIEPSMAKEYASGHR